MTPAADPVAAAPAVCVDVPQEVLADGEIVILAIRPSGFFVLLSAWPVLAVVGVIAAGLLVGTLFVSQAVRTVGLAMCVGALVERLVSVGLQWYRRLYVLTNRRIMRIEAGPANRINEVPLSVISRPVLNQSTAQRALGVASIDFVTEGDRICADITWSHISRGSEVLQIVSEAISRSR